MLFRSGNQLFQLARALSFGPDYKIILISNWGNPRTNKKSSPEISSFELPSNIEEVNLPKSGITVRLINANLKFNIKQYHSKLEKYFLGLLRKLLVFNLLFRIKRYFRLEIGKGLGYYDHKYKLNKKNSLLVGYFQSYIWASERDTFSKLKTLKPDRKSTRLNSSH